MDVRDHGFFVFFAPRDNPQIAGIVFAEHGLHGSSATPVAQHVLQTFFAKLEGKPLPPLPPSLRGTAAPQPAAATTGERR
jgi:penicillin-binding protein 2